MQKISGFLKEYKMLTKVIAILLGGLAGFLYYKLIGCRSGTCPLTDSPYISTLWGALIGFLLAA